MRKAKIFLINGVILTSTSLLTRGAGLIFNIYIANQVGSTAIGIFSLIMSVYNFAITVATSGLSISCTCIVSEEFEKKNYVVLPKLYETLGLSKFKTRNYIIELNKEFTEFKTKPEIQISEEAEIHVERVNLTDIKNLRRIYFQRSKIARLLTEIVDSKVTIEKFAENHFLSISRAYVKRRELVSFLEQHQIKLKKNILVGEEINIRNVLFGVYFGVFNGFSMPFRESVMNEAKSIVQYFEYLFNLKLSAIKRIKFNLLKIGRAHV